jgi:hypothetical protein
MDESIPFVGVEKCAIQWKNAVVDDRSAKNLKIRRKYREKPSMGLAPTTGIEFLNHNRG